MNCREKIGNNVVVLSVFLMFNIKGQQNCTSPINFWTLIMWLLILAKYLMRPEPGQPLNIFKLYCGGMLVNPITTFWAIKGIIYYNRAEGAGCFITTSRTLMIFQLIFGFMSVTIFILGTIWIVLYFMLRGIYHVLVKIMGRERVNRMRIFQLRLIVGPQMPPVLDTQSIEKLKEKIEKKVTQDDLKNEHFQESPCSICLDHFEVDQAILPLKCKHNYHTDCLATWILKNSCCPMCKTEIVVADYAAKTSPNSTENSALDTALLTRTNAAGYPVPPDFHPVEVEPPKN